MYNEKINYTILFVDYEIQTRKNYVNYLQAYYNEIYEASNGIDALKIYHEKKPDIIILDINIPKLNGLELLSKIRQFDHNTKAIILTAHSDKDSLIKASELKLTKYLIKPIKKEELKHSLEAVIKELSSFTFTAKKIIYLKDGFLWNITTKELSLNAKIISITSQEKDILEFLFLNTNTILSYDDIIIKVWDSFEINRINALKTSIKKLRRKLPQDIIKNVYGIGYKVLV